MTDHERESGFTRGDLARATGCNIETIRYYEKIGLLPDPPRTDAGYRIYSAAHATRLRFILRARELGFSMEDIRGLLGLEDGAAPTCAEVKERTERHLADVHAKIADFGGNLSKYCSSFDSGRRSWRGSKIFCKD